jgi:hypothetical protein
MVLIIAMYSVGREITWLGYSDNTILPSKNHNSRFNHVFYFKSYLIQEFQEAIVERVFHSRSMGTSNSNSSSTIGSAREVAKSRIRFMTYEFTKAIFFRFGEVASYL